LPIRRLWLKVSLMITKAGSRLSSLFEIAMVVFR
jgi:hypothetical protein